MTLRVRGFHLESPNLTDKNVWSVPKRKKWVMQPFLRGHGDSRHDGSKNMGAFFIGSEVVTAMA